jgi:hypothetical protein
MSSWASDCLIKQLQEIVSLGNYRPQTLSTLINIMVTFGLSTLTYNDHDEQAISAIFIREEIFFPVR